ncbi:MAG: dNTP triphosphohydrolase [Deltaproteobacteria bacterium]|nr:dNTP triphosphohydrolase [Deltaproteobacteria bacterium]
MVGGRVFDYGYTDKEKKEKGVRSSFQIDRDRIIHSSAFRRMRNKTQVFGVFTLDYYRTRLTHSLEVSQIARALTSILNKKYGLSIDLDIIEAVSLAHDIGHPPFGHLGEYIINEELKKATDGKFGFEANAQNIRILNFLEKKFYDSKNNKIYGINPSLKTIDGILKYKMPYSLSDKNKHFIYDDDIFILEKLHGKDFVKYLNKYSCFFNDKKNKTAKVQFFEFSRCIECQILNAADDIAYATHDIEDGVESKLINIGGHFKVNKYLKESGRFAKDSIDNINIMTERVDNFFLKLRNIFNIPENDGFERRTDSNKNIMHDKIADKYETKDRIMHHIKVKTDLKEFFSNYISKFILNIDLEERKEAVKKLKSKSGNLLLDMPLDYNDDSYKYSLIWKNGVDLEINALKQISYSLVMENREILLNRYKAENIVKKLYAVFSDINNIKLYPDDFQELYEFGFYDSFGKDKNGNPSFQIMCADYISGMTDMYAMKLYSSLFDARSFADSQHA